MSRNIYHDLSRTSTLNILWFSLMNVHLIMHNGLTLVQRHGFFCSLPDACRKTLHARGRGQDLQIWCKYKTNRPTYICNKQEPVQCKQWNGCLLTDWPMKWKQIYIDRSMNKREKGVDQPIQSVEWTTARTNRFRGPIKIKYSKGSLTHLSAVSVKKWKQNKVDSTDVDSMKLSMKQLDQWNDTSEPTNEDWHALAVRIKLHDLQMNRQEIMAAWREWQWNGS